MSSNVSGNLKGLSPSERRSIERLYNRRLGSEEMLSFDIGKELCDVASKIRRRIGILISREGRIEEVFVGSKDILYLPDISGYRQGSAGRLKRLRFIFSDLSNKSSVDIPQDIYGDLEIHRFDLVCAVKQIGNRISVSYAYLSFEDENIPIITEHIQDLGRANFDFNEFIAEREATRTVVKKNRNIKNGALLLGIYDKSFTRYEESLAELKELARSAGVQILDTFVQRKQLDPKTVIGKGKLEEVSLQALRLGAELIIFDSELKPSQWRAITNETSLKVLDRSMLILDIFAQRAQSSEGRLQVELAQLTYNLPRLVEKNTGLSRLSGGIGGRGPGETKLEISRRRYRDRINFLEEKLDEVGKQRELRKSKRRSKDIPVVAIVGYTNVGKSTLFNALTTSNVLSENKLFATLDTTQRRISIDLGDNTRKNIVLSDTVGFIRDLPKELMNAFKATLEELQDADLLLHILDASDSDIYQRFLSVKQILKELNLQDKDQVVVLNKIDKISEEVLLPLIAEYEATPLSAVSKVGFERLKSIISNKISLLSISGEVEIESHENNES